ncbi:MAG: filamentous hemagglutinin N-terminal domain-containing protein [Thermosynechococcaceae cyanobacterium]
MAKPIIPDGTTHTWFGHHCHADYCIKGGFRRGSNLFHSFRKFNVPPDEIAMFMHSMGIQNILVRVTGMSVSKILGTLSTQAGSTANLFFMNPNGIIFGAGSTLNVGGSFVGTTANAIRLKNGDIFSSNPAKPLPQQILQVKPSAFLFNQMAVKPIVIRSTDGLDVDEGKSLLFIGGDVRINHGQLHAFGGRIELGGLTGKGTVGLNMKGDSLKLSFSESQLLANVYLSHNAGVFAGSFIGDGGDILIHASNVRLDNSTLYVGIFGRDNNTAGSIKINATGNVIFNKSFATGTVEGVKGDAGLIVIKAGSLLMKNGSSLSVQNSGRGSAGTIKINADKIIIDDGNTDFNVDLNAISINGDGGKIYIYANKFKAVKGAALYASSENGNAGQISMNVRDNVIFDNSSAGSFTTSKGNAGTVKINTDFLVLRNGSKIDANSNIGNAGKIIINATNKIHLNNSIISVDVQEAGKGYVGKIKIDAGSLFLKNGAQINAQLYGSNDGLNSGQIFIKVKDLFYASGTNNKGIGSGILSQIEGKGGSAGNIKIVAGSLVLADGAILATATKGDGSAGNITIHATDDVRIDGALIQSNVENKSDAGNAGNIKINANSIFVTGGSEITSFTKSSGDAGEIILTATDSVYVSDEGTRILSEALVNSTGNGGEIKIVTDNLLVKNRALISTKMLGAGKAGGDIVVRATGLVRFDNAEATSLADTQFDGNAGDIFIRADRISLQNGGKLSTDSQGKGKAGTLHTNSNSLVLNNGIISSTSDSSNGGDITLKVRDLLTLQNGSQISTDIGSDGTGGNIDIQNKTGFIVAFPGNSDITANAGIGDGGQVTIRTQGLFGIQPQPQLTDGNDITASSQLGVQGTVTINRPDVDPTKDLSRLPDVVEDVSGLITQQCPTEETSGQFTVTGRGGIPPSPADSLSSNATSVGLVQVPNSSSTSLRQSLKEVPSQTETGAITKLRTKSPHQESAPATDWIFNETGDVTLVAQSNTNPASSIPLNSPQSCPALAGSTP